MQGTWQDTGDGNVPRRSRGLWLRTQTCFGAAHAAHTQYVYLVLETGAIDGLETALHSKDEKGDCGLKKLRSQNQYKSRL